jgi:hypothetical protein
MCSRAVHVGIAATSAVGGSATSRCRRAIRMRLRHAVERTAATQRRNPRSAVSTSSGSRVRTTNLAASIRAASDMRSRKVATAPVRRAASGLSVSPHQQTGKTPREATFKHSEQQPVDAGETTRLVTHQGLTKIPRGSAEEATGAVSSNHMLGESHLQRPSAPITN